LSHTRQVLRSLDSRFSQPFFFSKGSRNNHPSEFAPRFVPGWVDMWEHNRRRRKGDVEDCASEDRPNLARRWDAKMGSYYFASPSLTRHLPLSPVLLLQRFPWVVLVCLLFMGCSGPLSHYGGVERSLLVGQSERAIHIMQSAKDDYGDKSRLLFLMDYGMVLHLAGRYAESNVVLEDAYLLIEDLYTKRLRDEVSALLVNEARQPYEGAPYEHVMVNVVKALNYAFLQQWTEALVEVRRIDHRLNVLSDTVEGSDAYHEDPFARYLVGLLYDIAGDTNNAYVGYRKAEQVYEEERAWTRVPFPDILKNDLIQTAHRLGLHEDVERYQLKYPEVDVRSVLRNDPSLAQVVVVEWFPSFP